MERRLRSSLNEEDEPDELTFEEATGGTRGGGSRGNDYRVRRPGNYTAKGFTLFV